MLLEERPESVLSGRLVEELRLPEDAGSPRAAPQGRERSGRGRCRVPQGAPCRTGCARSSRRRPRASPDGDDWLHEIKFDGYRTLARIEGGAARLLTRTGLDWTDRYGHLARAVRGRCPASRR